MEMPHILLFAGTRPEAIKMAPVYHALKSVGDRCRVTLVASGQHREMLHQSFADFGITPDRDMDVMQPDQTLAGLTSRLFSETDVLLAEEQPDVVLVQGDTTTVMAAALCAFYRRIPVGHVEAGLRSFRMDAPFPEEMNRRVAALAATMHFAPTDAAAKNLRAEGIPEKSVFVTGNTVIDALLWMRDRNTDEQALPAEVQEEITEGRKIILLTGHRRENLDGGFASICDAVLELMSEYRDVAFVYPVHRNPRVRETVMSRLEGHQRIHLLPPQPYCTFVSLMNSAHIILTDSGGIQEEAPALGKPVLVMRDVTERPEGVAAGTAKLVGTEKNVIVASVAELLNKPDAYRQMACAVNPYGDGKAAARIAEITVRHLA